MLGAPRLLGADSACMLVLGSPLPEGRGRRCELTGCEALGWALPGVTKARVPLRPPEHPGGHSSPGTWALSGGLSCSLDTAVAPTPGGGPRYPASSLSDPSRWLQGSRCCHCPPHTYRDTSPITLIQADRDTPEHWLSHARGPPALAAPGPVRWSGSTRHLPLPPPLLGPAPPLAAAAPSPWAEAPPPAPARRRPARRREQVGGLISALLEDSEVLQGLRDAFHRLAAFLQEFVDPLKAFWKRSASKHKNKRSFCLPR